MNAQELREWENVKWREVEELEKERQSHKDRAKDCDDKIKEAIATIKATSLRLNTDQGELELQGVGGIAPEESDGEGES